MRPLQARFGEGGRGSLSYVRERFLVSGSVIGKEGGTVDPEDADRRDVDATVVGHEGRRYEPVGLRVTDLPRSIRFLATVWDPDRI